jgi:hypothetical protein
LTQSYTCSAEGGWPPRKASACARNAQGRAGEGATCGQTHTHGRHAGRTACAQAAASMVRQQRAWRSSKQGADANVPAGCRRCRPA